MDMEIDATLQRQLIKDDDLFKAAESGDSSVFRALSPEQFSKSLALRNEDGRSLLHVAVSSSHAEVRFGTIFLDSSFGCLNLFEMF